MLLSLQRHARRGGSIWFSAPMENRRDGAPQALSTYVKGAVDLSTDTLDRVQQYLDDGVSVRWNYEQFNDAVTTFLEIDALLRSRDAGAVR